MGEEPATSGKKAVGECRWERVREVAWVFLKLGTIGFGGPAAHIAMMEREIVEKRRWVTREHFLDLVGAVNLIPGPNSTEMAIHLGLIRAGWIGLVVGGACFILPAMAIVTAIAEAYVRYGEVPWVAGAMRGVTPVVLAIVAQAMWAMGKTAVRTPLLAGVAIAASGAAFAGVNELVILAAAGAVAGLAARQPGAVAGVPIIGASVGTAGAACTPLGLFGVFLKIGSVLFGSGYVLIAFLRTELVERRGWLTEQQLLDAVAVGQVTPGPVFTTATFIGHVLGGLAGGAAATAGIFLPAFAFVALSGPLVAWIRRTPRAAAALRGVTAASLALMAVAAVMLAKGALTDAWAVVIAAGAAAAMMVFKVSPTWVVAAGFVIGVGRVLI